MLNKTRSILMIAGEASGDLLGANLARELWRLQPDLKLNALGGTQLREAGVDIIFDNRRMDIMGWIGVIKNLKVIHAAMRKIKHFFTHTPPDVLILIDYPGFNLRVAKLAKKYGIKVLYYVSPQIWAWKYHRIKSIRRCVDHMAVLFAFEEEIYHRENVPVTWVGHPLTDLVRASDDPASIYRRYHLDPASPVIALFPGSRKQELRLLLPILVRTVEKIRVKIPKAQFVLPLAKSLRIEDLKIHLPHDITVIKNDTYNILSVCAAAIVKSGTGTLEVALAQVPQVIIYKCNMINYWIARAVIKVDRIGLCNIVAKKLIGKELIQQRVTSENISQEAIRLVTDLVYRSQILADLALLRAQMSGKENSRLVAQISLGL